MSKTAVRATVHRLYAAEAESVRVRTHTHNIATHSSDTTSDGPESQESTCSNSDGRFSKTSTETGGEKRLHDLDPEIKGNCVRDAHATASISCIAGTRNPLNPWVGTQ